MKIKFILIQKCKNEYVKTILFQSFFVLSLIFLSLSSCSERHSNSYLKKKIRNEAGIKKYIVKVDYYDDHQSYLALIISSSDKRLLLKRFRFEETLNKLRGRIEPSFVTESPDYIYHIIEDGAGAYGYVLYALERTGNNLIIYEIYGD